MSLPRAPITPEVAAQRNAAARRILAKNNPAASFTDKLDVASIYAHWNRPRPVSQGPFQQQIEEDLHKAEPVLDAAEIYERWNAPRPRAQQKD